MAEEPKKRRSAKDFLKSAVGTFVEFQPDGAEENKQEPQVQTVTIPITKMPSVSVDGTTQQTEVIDEALFETFGSVIEAANIPGPDYVELLTLANGKDEVTGEFVMAGDEAARYASAFRAIKLMSPNFTKDIVLNSIDEYIRILEAERTNAMAELQEIWNRDVATPEAELKKTEDEIGQLQKRLAELTTFASQRRQEIDKAKVDNQAKRASFEYTFNVFKSRFVDDKEKLTNILK